MDEEDDEQEAEKKKSVSGEQRTHMTEDKVRPQNLMMEKNEIGNRTHIPSSSWWH